MHTEERPYLNELFTLHSLLVSNAVLIKITRLSSPKLGYFSEIAVDPTNRHFVENRVSESMKHRWHPDHTYASETSVDSRYNAVQFITILHTALRLKWRKVNHIWESQQTPHISPSRASYGVFIVKIFEKIDLAITTPRCSKYTLIPYGLNKWKNKQYHNVTHSCNCTCLALAAWNDMMWSRSTNNVKHSRFIR